MQEELPIFTPLDIQDNPLGWGPHGMPDQLNNMPYQPYSKGDLTGRVADWRMSENDKKYIKKYQSQISGGTQYTYYHEEDERSFQLVDTERVRRVGYFKRSQMIRGQGGRSGFNQLQSFGTLNKEQRDHMQRKKKTQFNKNNMQIVCDASVIVRANWNTIEELDFVRFSKLSLPNIKDPEDLVCCGSLGYFNKSYDKINLQNEKPLKHIDRIFHTVSTTDDPIIRKLVKTVGNVYATDTILACLMCCTQSKYSWDIVVEKVGDKLFFDKRENSDIDLHTVNETAIKPPSDEANSLNSPRNLALEATLINQNFSQQVLKSGEPRYKFDEPNPFISDDETEGKVASVAYRYRKWNIGDGIVLVARCEHNSVLQISNGDLQFLTIKALNEWNSNVSGSVDWRQKLDVQRTGILATELRNNAYKLAKWTVQALLAGSDYIKFGYVSRVQMQDSSKHVILGTQQYKPTEFAAQINLNIKNAWGILRCIIDLCMKQEDGKYLIMKDPNKPLIRLYGIPDNTFGSDIEDNEADESGKISTVPAELLPPNP